MASGCRKDLDLDSDTFFGVKELLKSKNCEADCGETASCEGKIVKIKGKIDENNINEDVSTFFILDEKDEDYSISVEVEASCKEETFDKIRTKGGHGIKIEAKIQGFDMPVNFSCSRGFVLKLEEADKITVE